MESTGPKISSRAIVMSLRTLAKTVGLHEVALGDALGPAGPAGHQLGALLDALLDERLDLVELRLARERADGDALGWTDRRP